MTYTYPPPPGGVRAPSSGSYGQQPPPPMGAPPSQTGQAQSPIGGPPGHTTSAGRGSAALGGQPPPPQQAPPQHQYGGYSSSLGPSDRVAPASLSQQQFGSYGSVAPPSQTSSQHQHQHQHQRPPGPPSVPPPSAPAPASFAGPSAFTRRGPTSNGMRMGANPPPPVNSPPPLSTPGGGLGQQLLPPPPTQPPQQHQPGLGGGGGGPAAAPASAGRGAQFFSVGGGMVSTTPTPLQGGPPTGPPGPPSSLGSAGGMNMPPTSTQSIASQLGQMSLGGPPNGVGSSRAIQGAAGRSSAAPPMMPYGGAGPPTGPPGMQQQVPPGYGNPPGGGMGYAPRQGGGAYGIQPPQGQGNPAATGSSIGAATSLPGQPILPSIHETDMSIQANPRVMRMTVGAVPNTSSAHAQSKIPLGLVIQAMALDIDQKDGGLEVVNFGAQGIMRCKRCRTYINPFVAWLSNGRQWRCNVCGMVNDVPTGYMCHLDHEGNRSDKTERPELSQASVELVAPAEYMVRPPQPPVFMFVIDVSAPAVASGMVHVAAETIKACLDNLPGEDRTLVGVCTYDSGVHYYNLKSTLSQPQMLVVPDLTDPFPPVPDDLLVNLSESRAVVESLLESLAQMHARTRDTECCLGPALSAAGRVMAHVGGKMVVMCGGLPSAGEARLKHRENPRNLGTDREHLLLKAEDPWYQNKAVEFSKLQICVDLFLFSAQYTDVATVANLPKFTAGQLFYYHAFTAQHEGDKFNSDLTRVLTRATAFEAVMRVRATRGLRITNFYGNYFIRGTDLLALPNCTPDSVFAVEFGYDEQILSASVICVQAALLYTTSGGERRIRVHNLALPVETVIQNVIDSVNIDVLCNILAKQALQVTLKTGLDNARGRIQQTCVDIVRASRGGGYGSSPYMAHGAQQQQGTSISEAIQLLPLYSMALQKNVAFRGGTDVRADERAFMQAILSNMPVDHSRCFTYPRMFRLHDMPEDIGESMNAGEHDEIVATAGKALIKLPSVANLSAERLSSDGVFLLENGVELYLWVGREASPAIVSALFSVPTLEGQDLSSLQMQPEGNMLCQRINNIIAALREERMTYLKVNVVYEGEGHNERRFYWHLVEDRASFPGGSMNYAEYMENINRHSVGGMGVAIELWCLECNMDGR